MPEAIAAAHVKRGLVSYEEALRHVANPDDFALRFKGVSGTSDSKWDDFEEDRADDEDMEMESLEKSDSDLKIERF